jgi:putative transposase
LSIPYRGSTSESTYFITANVFGRTQHFQVEKHARLFLDVMLHYRKQAKYLLHEFVVMTDHFHLLITPTGITLERAVQLIKGGYSFRLGKEIGTRREIWQTSFVDRRVRDSREYSAFRDYIWENPVKRNLWVCPVFCVNDQGLVLGLGWGRRGRGSYPSPASSMY